MKRVHFIAIGGSAMHNLAIALHLKGYNVTGSDDEIFDPAKSRLEKYGLLPKNIGWNPDNIVPEIDAIILGIHTANNTNKQVPLLDSFHPALHDRNPTGNESTKRTEVYHSLNA